MPAIKLFSSIAVITMKQYKKDMIQEEKIIREHDSGRNPFVVPEGYFEGFTEKMMARVKAEAEGTENRQATVVKLPLWKRAMRYAAAVAVVVLMVGGGLFYALRTPSGDVSTQLAAQTDQLDFYFSDDDLDAVLDYELVDNQHIAYYLTEAY